MVPVATPPPNPGPQFPFRDEHALAGRTLRLDRGVFVRETAAGRGAPGWTGRFLLHSCPEMVLFALLATLPDRESTRKAPEVVRPEGWERFLPASAFGSAALAVLLTAVITTLLVLVLTRGTPAYGATLFIGIPFFAGLLSSVLHAARQPRKVSECVWSALLSLLLTGALLLAFATEGIACLVMAAPLAVCEAVAGALVGSMIMDRRHKVQAAVLPVLYVLPLLFAVEKAPSPAQPPLRSVVSEVRINAPIETVWKNVIGFTKIPPPRELIFRAGVACPESAQIDGRGVGAVRHCVFSTGEFVEPITAWDEPERLAFDVSAQPDPLRELSPYGHLETPHLKGYFRTEHGESRLISAGQTTLLRGTTWYRLGYAPERYWSFWSDYLIHRIHWRVLEHIRQCSEAAPR